MGRRGDAPARATNARPGGDGLPWQVRLLYLLPEETHRSPPMIETCHPANSITRPTGSIQYLSPSREGLPRMLLSVTRNGRLLQLLLLLLQLLFSVMAAGSSSYGTSDDGEARRVHYATHSGWRVRRGPPTTSSSSGARSVRGRTMRSGPRATTRFAAASARPRAPFLS